MTDFLLTEAMQNLAQGLGMLNKRKATGGSTTTIVDTTQPSATNNLWKNGYMFIAKTTDGLAPQGEFNRISAYDNSTKTFTVETAFTDTAESGDVYSYIDDTYPGLLLVDWINQGLRALDMLDLTDITTITMADDQTEYAGAVEWKRSKPWKIERATDDDTNDYGWKEITDWDWNSAAAGSTPLIIFKQQYPTSYTTVKIHYKDLHPKLSAYSDKIREEVHPELAVKAAIMKALEWNVGANSGQDDSLNQRLYDSRNEFDRALIRYPVTRSEVGKTTKTIELAIW